MSESFLKNRLTNAFKKEFNKIPNIDVKIEEFKNSLNSNYLFLMDDDQTLPFCIGIVVNNTLISTKVPKNQVSNSEYSTEMIRNLSKRDLIKALFVSFPCNIINLDTKLSPYLVDHNAITHSTYYLMSCYIKNSKTKHFYGNSKEILQNKLIIWNDIKVDDEVKSKYNKIFKDWEPINEQVHL